MPEIRQHDSGYPLDTFLYQMIFGNRRFIIEDEAERDALEIKQESEGEEDNA